MKNEESKYPSVGLAYEAAKTSYDVMVNRFEAANARIQNIMTWAIGLTSAIPLLAKAVFGDTTLSLFWLLPILVTFLILIIVGIIAYRSGGVKQIHPTKLYEEYIQYPEWEYKKWLVYWAGKHFDTNQDLINAKSRYIDAMVILLGLEAILMVLWIVAS